MKCHPEHQCKNSSRARVTTTLYFICRDCIQSNKDSLNSVGELDVFESGVFAFSGKITIFNTQIKQAYLFRRLYLYSC